MLNHLADHPTLSLSQVFDLQTLIAQEIPRTASSSSEVRKNLLTHPCTQCLAGRVWSDRKNGIRVRIRSLNMDYELFSLSEIVVFAFHIAKWVGYH